MDPTQGVDEVKIYNKLNPAITTAPARIWRWSNDPQVARYVKSCVRRALSPDHLTILRRFSWSYLTLCLEDIVIGWHHLTILRRLSWCYVTLCLKGSVIGWLYLTILKRSSSWSFLILCLEGIVIFLSPHHPQEVIVVLVTIFDD